MKIYNKLIELSTAETNNDVNWKTVFQSLSVFNDVVIFFRMINGSMFFMLFPVSADINHPSLLSDLEFPFSFEEIISLAIPCKDSDIKNMNQNIKLDDLYEYLKGLESFDILNFENVIYIAPSLNATS
jgi:hypothetical protein